MNNFMTKCYVKLVTSLRDETGEVGSWLIVAAGLAAAAVAAVTVLGEVIGDLADKVQADAGV